MAREEPKQSCQTMATTRWLLHEKPESEDSSLQCPQLSLRCHEAQSQPWKVRDTNFPVGLALAPGSWATMATMANGSEGRVHAQLSLKLQLLALLVADTDPGEID